MYINFFSVLLAAVAGMGVGWLWYSPYLLGDKWKGIMGTKWEDAQAGFTPTQAMGIEREDVFAVQGHRAFGALVGHYTRSCK